MSLLHSFYLCSLLSLISVSAWSQQALNPDSCPVPVIPPRPIVDAALLPGEIYITAEDQGELTEGGLSTLQGNVEISRGNHQLRADRVVLDQSAGTADIGGDINYWNNAIYLHGDTAHIEFNNNSGNFEQVSYNIIDNLGHGSAGHIVIVAEKYTRGSDIDYTTCAPQASAAEEGVNPWQITARDLILNHETDRGVARHAVLKIRNFPVLYTPYLSFPLSDRRESGFLMPLAGASNRNGLELQTPWYWNISPNMDATITPRVLTDRGVMIMGEYRYLFATGEGSINAEYLPGDSEDTDSDRSFITLEHNQSLAEHGKFYVLFNNVSDKQYFQDFGQTQASTSSQFLERRAELSWTGSRWDMVARIHDYQIIDESLPVTARTYRRLPQILFNTRSPARNNAVNYQLNSELVYFERGENPLLDDVNGFRFDIIPSISWPVVTAATYISPKLGIRYTRYDLEENTLYDETSDRLLPFASLDSGIFLERTFQLDGKDYLQTLEPRLYYLFIPRSDQSDLPVFDTGIDNFSFESMFHENRFVGGDRVGDANQITLSVTSRMINARGIEGARLHIGQIFYFNDRKVVLPGQAAQTGDLSAFVAGFSTNLFQHLYLRGDLEWDADNEVTRKLALQAGYRLSADKVFNLGYRMRRAVPGIIRNELLDIEQTSVAAHWPLAGNWSVVGSWKYALTERRSLDMFAGVEYNSCCWGFRAVGRRFLSNLEGDYQNGIFLQFELKGLAGTGRKTLDFLSENIPGYQSDF